MRIIAGTYGGRIIKTPVKKSIHPMSERIRGAIFNSLQVELVDKNILDAFAGSGALGLEALSRGAKQATFVEKDRQAASIIKQNLETLNVHQDNYQIIPTTILNWLDKSPNNLRFDLIFADPPYHDLQNQTVLSLKNLLIPDGKLILSQPKSVKSLEIPDLQIIDERIYAEAKIIYYLK